MPDNKCVITEQGYVEGFGLGVTPIKESELNNKKDNKDEDNKDIKK